MPITRRALSTVDALQPSAKPKYIESNKDVLGHVPAENRRRASFVVYGFGKTLPKHMPIEDIAYTLRLCDNEGENEWPVERAVRNRIKGRLSAIRAFCVMCAGGPKAARECQTVTCPLHAFRMGTNPYRRKS